MRTYTKSEVMNLVRERFRLINAGTPTYAGGLTEKNLEVLGEIDLALGKDTPQRSSSLNARIAREYPRPNLNA